MAFAPFRCLALFTLTAMIFSQPLGAQTARIDKIDAPPALTALPMHTGGRMLAVKSAHGLGTAYRFQWPGIYFAAAFTGPEVYFATGPGDAILHLRIDDQPPLTLSKPRVGVFRVGGLAAGAHTIRIEFVNESQSAPMEFGGLALAAGGIAGIAPRSARQIEFIGDSHTVGYGNTHPTHESTPELVWATTDNSQAYSALAAKHCGADYRVIAISGRGIVRNYDGFAADTLPLAYPHILFGRSETAADPGWHPQVIVVGLGSNDFSTKLNPGEKWKTRDELHADYEATYVRFVQGLRAANPGAFFILESNEVAEGEVHAEVGKVVARLQAAGEKRIATLTFRNLELTACDWHPSLKDHRYMAGVVTAFLDAHPELWPPK